MSSKQIVLTAGTELFGHRDRSAVDRHWAPDFRQHSALGADGPDGLRAAVERLPEDFRIDLLRVLEDGDMVAVHCVYHGFGPDPMVAVDVFRVQDGLIAEHWDALAPLPGGPAGTHRIDGPRQVTGHERTAANKDLVTEWVHERLLGADRDALEELARDPRYVEHGPATGTGLTRRAVHRVLGDGDFVLTVTEGLLDDDDGAERGDPVTAGCYDLWRVADGRIVEHWEVCQPVPERLPHDNGFF
ncbi:nuclear transport factor 2 family protein [Kocuria sp. NPDC057446]|uniref:nuclear transport factor 2 family protein n=1 Tax=Kocuria sp. NPDC057446 TaxID=3346137 RepID=UPI0036C23245